MESLQDLIDLIIFKSQGKITGEIYFKGRSETFTAFDCEELIGRLLEYDIEITNWEDPKALYEYKKITINQSNIDHNDGLELGNFHNFLRGCFLHEEIIDGYQSHRIEILTYFKLCNENNITVNFSSFDTFLTAYGIEHKEYSTIMLPNGYKTSSGLLHEIYYTDEDKSQKDIFLESLSNTNRAFYYKDCQYADFLYILTYHILKDNKILKKCQNCNRWFVPKRKNEKYCEHQDFFNEFIDGNRVINVTDTCKELVKKEIRKERDSKNHLTKIENNKRTTLLNRTKASTISGTEKKERNQKYYDFLNEMQTKKEMRKNGLISYEEYEKWLNDYKI